MSILASEDMKVYNVRRSGSRGIYMSSQDRILKALLSQITQIENIQPGDFPDVDLYMDQVTTYLDTHIASIKFDEDDVVLTKTMINNYVKSGVLPPPVNKKYSKQHLIMLIFIYYFKGILPVSEVKKMLDPINEEFFNDDDMNVEFIYSEMYDSIKNQIVKTSKDVYSKSFEARQHFTDIKDISEREELQNFIMMGMLAFDIFLKRKMLEKLIETNYNMQTNKKSEQSAKGGKSGKNDKQDKSDKSKK